jgi:hypothetical protein
MRPVAAADVVALVPAHAEPPTEALLEGIAAQVGSILVVSDGMAPEALGELQRRAAARGADVLVLDTRNGKGSALVAGLARVLARSEPPDGVIVVDADGQHPPDAIPRFLGASSSADLVIGDRLGDLRSMPLARGFGNIFATAAVTLAARRGVRDTQCGMRLLTRRALREIPFPGGGFEAETLHLKACLAAGVPVAWVPIPALYDSEPSAFRTARDSLVVLRAAVAPARRSPPAPEPSLMPGEAAPEVQARRARLHVPASVTGSRPSGPSGARFRA